MAAMPASRAKNLKGSSLRVSGFGFRVSGIGLGALGFRVSGIGFGAQGFGFELRI